MTLFSLTECFMSHADYADYTDSYIAIACMCLRTRTLGIADKLRAVLAMQPSVKSVKSA